jgi:hypothetical protein
MIAPMLLDSPKSTSDSEGGGGGGGNVRYLKLYMMFINVMKSVMLLIGILGPQTIATVVISSTVSSFILGSVTLRWFIARDIR